MNEPDVTSTRFQLACLLTLLALAALLRFFDLETPSMWWDEIYTPMTARYPFDYIVEWCRTLEIQPPYFYFAMKTVMAMGNSDFALRWPFALAGLGAVAMTYQLGRLALGPVCGLGAAAIVAFNPMLLWLSRTLRIYPLLHLGLAASLYLFLLAFGRARRWAEIGLYTVNLVMLLLHYSAVLMVGAEFAVLLSWRFFSRQRVGCWTVVRFGLVSLLSFAPAAPFFFIGMVEGSRLDVRSSYQTVAGTVMRLLGQDLTYFGLPWTGWVVLGLAILGAINMRRKSPMALGLLCLSLSLPMAAVVAKRYDSHLFAAHLAFLTVPLAVLAGASLVLIRDRFSPALLVAILATSSTWWALGPARGEFYAPDSHDRRIFRLGVFKEIARAAPAAIGNLPVLCPDMTQYNAINWYLSQFSAHNPLVDQRLDRDRESTDLLFWCGFDNFGHLATDRNSFLVRYPEARQQPSLDTVNVYSLRIPRQPLTVAGSDQSVLRLDSAPEHFYQDISTLSGVMISPYFSNAVMPTANDVWGTFEYDIFNTSSGSVTTVTLVAHYANRGRENRVEMEYCLDGGPWRPALASLGPDPSGKAVVHLETNSPWNKLTVRCRLWCAPLTPLSGGSNLSTVIFKGIDFYICGQAQSGDCQTRMSIDLLPQGFPASLGPEQILGTTTNVALHESQEYPGWSYYSAKDAVRAGEILIHLPNGGQGLVCYPRVNSRQSTVVAEVGGAVNSLRGLPEVWTPVGLALPLPENGDSGDVRFRLEGSAQLWSRDGRLVFIMPSGNEKSAHSGIPK